MAASSVTRLTKGQQMELAQAQQRAMGAPDGETANLEVALPLAAGSEGTDFAAMNRKNRSVGAEWVLHGTPIARFDFSEGGHGAIHGRSQEAIAHWLAQVEDNA